jgi:hypothetical protein
MYFCGADWPKATCSPLAMIGNRRRIADLKKLYAPGGRRFGKMMVTVRKTSLFPLCACML